MTFSRFAKLTLLERKLPPSEPQPRVSDGGSTTAVTAVPGKGFHFVNWTDANNHVVSYSATLKFSNVTASKRVTANFK